MKKFLCSALFAIMLFSCVTAAFAETFTESIAYKVIVAEIDTSLANWEPKYEYDDESKLFVISLGCPDGTAASLLLGPVPDSWQTVCDAMNQLCTTVKDALTTAGHKDVQVSVVLRNDANEDNILFASFMGVTFFNAADAVKK